MKKTGKICIFVIILIAVLLSLSQISVAIAKWDSTLAGQRNQKHAEILAEKKNTLDMIIIGDSEGYTALSPMQMWQEHGTASYNACQVGQYIQEMYYLLRAAFKVQNPKLILIETNVLFRNQDAVSDAKLTLAEIGKHYFPIFRYHDIWKPLLTGERYNVNYKGFQVNNNVKPYEGGTYMDKASKEVKISAETLKYMDKVKRLCEKNGAQLLLVSVPSPLNYDMNTHKILQEYADENGLAYFDMNLYTEEMGIDWNADTTDKGDHMNICGAQKVTGYLGRYLAKHYEMKDHRTDEAYQHWNEAIAAYETVVEKESGLILETARNLNKNSH